MKLKKPLIIKNFGAEERKIEEINIKKEDFTAKVIIDAEQSFLMSSGVFPAEGMHNSRKFLTFVLAELLEVRYENLLELDGEDCGNVFRKTGAILSIKTNTAIDYWLQMPLTALNPWIESVTEVLTNE